ncbi:U-box domain-containing protein 44-like isoform X2 [Punica granatum]|uniref:RING-type E3 ubiquitin transferase n=1 Tax=Punica granatum TaxID=22663 RepID=A0A6P8DD59_PUNGR|nr:U-box domain-containing protein 44-like isoform X2 [Punica granatum]
MTSQAEAAAGSIRRSLDRLCSAAASNNNHRHQFDNYRRFSDFAARLQLALDHLLRSSPAENLPASAQTALRGIASDLENAVEIASAYRERSKIFVLANCVSLATALQERTGAIGGWLALLDPALQGNPEIRKKVADLSRDMKQSHFTVTENEKRVHSTLQKEGEGRQLSKAVQSAIVMDLTRALGIESNNYSELSAQIRLLKDDLDCSTSSPSDRRILASLEGILNNWSARTDITTAGSNFAFEDEDHIPPFKNFLCPLTKEYMKDPVVLESSQTYERSAVKHWFDRCIEDGQDPTCPVTGQVLRSLVLKPNIGLAGAIEEWVNRNIDIQIKSALAVLTYEPLRVENIERALDGIYQVSEEHPSSRYKVRNSGLVSLIVKLLRDSSKSIGTHLRSKALLTLLSMTKDEESKKMMLDEGMLKLTIHSLTGRSEKEREHAIKLLLEFSYDEACCTKIALEKGALVLLTSIAGNLEHPAASNLAEVVLIQIEKTEGNIEHLAAAGRFEPLLSRLREGPIDVKIQMASIMGRMMMTSGSKEQIARQSATTLVELLSKQEGKELSLQALHNLSALDDNARVLVDASVLPSLTHILFSDEDASEELKELAASTVANIVSNPGHWELASSNSEFPSMQSKEMVSKLFGLLSAACSSNCHASILRVLCGIASSPQASGIYPQEVHEQLKHSNKLSLLKDKLLDSTKSTETERSDAACTLANLPLTDVEVKAHLEGTFVRWAVTALMNYSHGPNRRFSQPAFNMVEGILGLLLHLTRQSDQQCLALIREHGLMVAFREHLGFPSTARAKQLACFGLRNLSELGREICAAELDSPRPLWFCSSLAFICGDTSRRPSTCPIHDTSCNQDSQLCLLQSDCVKPLCDLLTDEDSNVQMAAVEALSTLVSSTATSTLKKVVEELDRQGVIDSMIGLFVETRSGELQEKAISMIERTLRVERHAVKHSLNQSLVKALVEALKHGNANTRGHAQDALMNLQQLSGVSGNSSSQIQMRR